jgi:hypothetical protein
MEKNGIYNLSERNLYEYKTLANGDHLSISALRYSAF